MRAPALVALALGLGWALPAPAADPSEPRSVTTTGDAEVRVAPDEVTLTLGVETWDQDLGAARDQNEDRTKRVIDSARRNGVEAKNIQTDYLAIEPRYRDGYQRSDFIGYFVQKTIVLTLRDIGRFESVLSAALAEGATHVHGVQFRTTELRTHRDRARALAVKAAREKAAALAGELGQAIGRPWTIREDDNRWWSWHGAWWGSRWSAAGAQNVIQTAGEGPGPAAEGGLAVGQITVTARVTVTFELQ